jgi:hypothetical protein
MKKISWFLLVGIACGGLFTSKSVHASAWQIVPELEAVESWQFNSNSTVVESVADENGSGAKVIQILGSVGEPESKNHAIASASSPLLADGGTLFFKLRFPAADGSMMNGRICFSAAGLNPGNHSSGFKFTGSEKIGAAALNPAEAAAKAAWLSPDRWYWVWFSPDSANNSSLVTIRDAEGGQEWEFKPGLNLPANVPADPFSFFGIVIGGSKSPRPVQMADFRWTQALSTELPEGIAP